MLNSHVITRELDGMTLHVQLPPQSPLERVKVLQNIRMMYWKRKRNSLKHTKEYHSAILELLSLLRNFPMPAGMTRQQLNETMENIFRE